MPRIYGITPEDIIEKVGKYLSEHVATVDEALVGVKISYETYLRKVPKEARDKLKALAKSKLKPEAMIEQNDQRVSVSKIQEIRDMIPAMKEFMQSGDKTINDLMSHFHVNSPGYYTAVPESVRKELSSHSARYKANKESNFTKNVVANSNVVKSELVIKVDDPLRELYSVKKSENKFLSAKLLELPMFVFKAWTDQVLGKVINLECRFFTRCQKVEDTIYYVAGYEYMSHPEHWVTDEKLHVFSLESFEEAYGFLLTLVTNRLEFSIHEPALGEVMYSIKRVRATKQLMAPDPATRIQIDQEYREIKSVTPVKKLSDGNYTCRIGGKQGAILYMDEEYYFMLEEPVPMYSKNAECRVAGGFVYVKI